MKEADVEKHLVQRATALGCTVRKVKWIGRVGAPDRFVYGPDIKPFFVELKRPKGGVLSWHQAQELDALNDGGMDAFVASTPEQIDALLNRMTR